MIVVSGASDDLIEVEGDIRAEFNANPEGDLLAFANGVLLRVTYKDVWRIEPVAGRTLVGIDQAPEDDEASYTDRATIIGPCNWVACGDQWARSAA